MTFTCRCGRIPVGCKCTEDWNATRQIPDICKRFEGGDPDTCRICRHDVACHPASLALDPLLARIRRAGEDLERAVRAR